MKLLWLTGVIITVMLIGGCTGQKTVQQQNTTTAAPDTVDIKDFAYNPATINISKGITVTWTQLDSAPHTVTSIPDEPSNQRKVLDSPLLNKGQTFSHTFYEIGNFEYTCTIHPSMIGKVVVT